jgi:radical SAM protein with 4Fe4S-binding SPASM domain
MTFRKITRGLHIFHFKCLMNKVNRYIRNYLAIPLFNLQKNFTKSYLPAPVQIVIEPTNRCNLNCKMCARRYWDVAANPLGDMSIDFFSKYIKPNLKSFQAINLQCFGEPLINKDFLAMLTACKSVGCYTTFTTNGVVLEQIADAIVSSGADEVTLSIDGVRSMQQLRNIGINKMIAAIDAINESKRRYNSITPLIGVNCVLTSDVLPELPELIEIAGVHGVSRVTVMHLGIHDLSLVEKSVLPIYHEAEKYFTQAKTIARRFQIDLFLPPRPETKSKCHHPFNSVVINWNGDVRPCCESVINEKGALIVGNLKDRTLRELWNSTYMHKLRKALVDENNLPGRCMNCPERTCSLETHIHLYNE